MFKKLVGEIGISSTDFFLLDLKHAELIIEGYHEKIKAEMNYQSRNLFHVQQYAMYNAIGYHFHGKKFKPIDIFKDSEESDKPSIRKANARENRSMLESLKNRFDKLGGD